MKGPGLRIRNDVRRRWKCPETGNILKTPGSVTHLYSPFVKQARWMKLEEEFAPARKQIPLQEILERMVIEAPEEETEEETAPKEEETKPDESAQAEETQEDTEGKANP